MKPKTKNLRQRYKANKKKLVIFGDAPKLQCLHNRTDFKSL